MLIGRAQFRTFSKMAEGGVNPLRVANRSVWWTATFMIVCVVAHAQPLNVTITEYPNRNSTGSGFDITSGPDGALWYTENVGNKIGRMTTSGVFTEFNVPTPSANPEGITSGPDGALWFTEYAAHKIGRITTSGIIAEYAIPNLQASPVGITSGPDGALWFTTVVGSIGRITTAGTITLYPLSSNVAGAFGITSGPDSALWFTEYLNGTNAFGRITTDGVIKDYPIPSTSISATARSITTGPDGAIWCAIASSIFRLATTGNITQYSIPTPGNFAWGITASSDGALWFTEFYDAYPYSGSQGKIGRITTSGEISEYSLPNNYINTAPNLITAGNGGALWFTEGGFSGIASVQTLARSGVLSHIAANGGWTTVITLVNTSAAAVPVTVALHNDDGSALSTPVTTTQQGTSQTTSASSVTATINPNSTLLLSMGGQGGSTVVGWADVTSIGPVNGYAIFRTSSPNSPVSEGTVPLQSQFPSTITLPYDNTTGFVMGVALANLSTASASVTATIWDANGNQLGTQTITIAGNGHTSFVLPTQLPMTAGQLGIVQFQATGGIAGLGLRFSPFGTFTSVPVF